MNIHDRTPSEQLRLTEKTYILEEYPDFLLSCEWHSFCLCLGVTQQFPIQLEALARFQNADFVSDSNGEGISTSCAEADPGDLGLAAFLDARGRLFGIAYRVVKNAADAEDVVQDVWVRWQMKDRSAVRDAGAFLATTTMRLAINLIQSAHWRRETDLDFSLSEPVASGACAEAEASRSEAFQLAVVALLEKLSPSERAAFVLREAFDYSYREIADILQVQEANARQLVTRARRHVADDRRASLSAAEQRHFLAAFAAAAQNGALESLEAFFAGTVRGAHGNGERVARISPTTIEPEHDTQFWPAVIASAAA